jgi:archaellum component FlaC
MGEREIFNTRAEADTKHLLAKLNEAEAEALKRILKAEERIHRLKEEVEASENKREVLKQKFIEMQQADEHSWEIARDEFIKSVESLEDKNVFKSKTEEWFKNIKDVASELKEGFKEKVSHW